MKPCLAHNWRIFVLLIVFLLPSISRAQTPTPDISPHKTLFISADKDVTLEVLDWGGNGPPLVLLSGWGNTAHVFDTFAPQFTARHHVYGITRRGFGRSSKPTATIENYDSDRLGDDVLAVIDTLKLSHPIIAGHSVAGEEMSSIGSRHPEKVAGLIYLEAAYAFAYYDPKGGYTVQVEADAMRRDLEQLMAVDGDPDASRALIQDIQTNIPNLEKSLQRDLANYDGTPQPPSGKVQTLEDLEGAAMRAGRRKYGPLKVPALAIIAVPYNCKADCDRADQKAWAQEIEAQADAFEAGNPNVHVIRLAHADHYIFKSNEADVLREMNAFMATLQ